MIKALERQGRSISLELNLAQRVRFMESIIYWKAWGPIHIFTNSVKWRHENPEFHFAGNVHSVNLLWIYGGDSKPSFEVD